MSKFKNKVCDVRNGENINIIVRPEIILQYMQNAYDTRAPNDYLLVLRDSLKFTAAYSEMPPVFQEELNNQIESNGVVDQNGIDDMSIALADAYVQRDDMRKREKYENYFLE